jgi:hypothetical protein
LFSTSRKADISKTEIMKPEKGILKLKNQAGLEGERGPRNEVEHFAGFRADHQEPFVGPLKEIVKIFIS